jgi:hypothetical protein
MKKQCHQPISTRNIGTRQRADRRIWGSSAAKKGVSAGKQGHFDVKEASYLKVSV